MDLARDSDGAAMRVESADLWHRRMRYVNSNKEHGGAAEGTGQRGRVRRRCRGLRCLCNREKRTTKLPQTGVLRRAKTFPGRHLRSHGAHQS